MTTEATPEVPTTPAPMPANGTEAPRITLADVESEIVTIAYMTGSTFVSRADQIHHKGKGENIVSMTAVTTICMTVLKNGYVVIGQATPASPENYDQAQGKKLAYDKCIQQLYPILGYQLKEQLHRSA